MQNNLISIGYLDGAAHLLSQIESNNITKLTDLYDLAFADSIRLRGTWEIVVNKSIENEWIIVGFDDEIWLGQGLHEQLKSGDSKSMKDNYCGCIQKQPTWVRSFQMELAVQNNTSQMMMKGKHLGKLIISIRKTIALKSPNGG